jgi:hypothetical protein
VFGSVPTFSSIVLMLKLFGSYQFIAEGWGTAIFVAAASFLHGLVAPSLWESFPKFLKQGHEPLFYDARLSLSEKFKQWHSQPAVSAQLARTAIALAVLGIGVTSYR